MLLPGSDEIVVAQLDLLRTRQRSYLGGVGDRFLATKVVELLAPTLRGGLALLLQVFCVTSRFAFP